MWVRLKVWLRYPKSAVNPWNPDKLCIFKIQCQDGHRINTFIAKRRNREEVTGHGTQANAKQQGQLYEISDLSFLFFGVMLCSLALQWWQRWWITNRQELAPEWLSGHIPTGRCYLVAWRQGSCTFEPKEAVLVNFELPSGWFVCLKEWACSQPNSSK